MNAATPHRVKLILLVAVFAAVVIAALVLESARLERFMALMPTGPAPDLATASWPRSRSAWRHGPSCGSPKPPGPGHVGVRSRRAFAET